MAKTSLMVDERLYQSRDVYSSPMASLVLNDSSQLTALKSYQTKLCILTTNHMTFKNMCLAAVTSDSQNLGIDLNVDCQLAGKPPVGLHLDVLKGDKLIQKLMIDEKKCYLFGRNPQMNDFCIDHASCSRVHSALVYHKQLNRAFLVDLGSTHGTYIGSLRLEADKPTQLPIDSTFHFGASTRYYIIRERPQTGSRPIIEELEKNSEEAEGGLLGLPETETELDNLTEFNTAHNRRISMLGIPDEEIRPTSRKRKKKIITFSEEEEVINPEDVDPSVGRFRNMIHTTVIPTKVCWSYYWK
uniref:Nuclear inhibitor of protein phosphatase 1 n=1 Tax=Timema shepardi TaxID=629360 RepID=A0A7R9G186_TIMSH|nr:unnamed protein product [Timema shepardi]